MDEALRIEPIAGRVFGANGVSLEPVAACERLSLRADQRSIAAIGKAIGVGLPRKPGTVSGKNGISALWIGPDEWYLIALYGTDVVGKINKVRTGNYSAVSIDHRNTGLIVSGPKAILALNSGCPRDLSTSAFPIGTCSRTILGKAEIVLWRIEENEFRVECWRSFSDYVWKYLMDAARSA